MTVKAEALAAIGDLYLVIDATGEAIWIGSWADALTATGPGCIVRSVHDPAVADLVTIASPLTVNEYGRQRDIYVVTRALVRGAKRAGRVTTRGGGWFDVHLPNGRLRLLQGAAHTVDYLVAKGLAARADVNDRAFLVTVTHRRSNQGDTRHTTNRSTVR
jgi:hypothetical protein